VSAFDEKTEVKWVTSWGGTTYVLSGLHPFGASVWSGRNEQNTYDWRISICGVKMKKGYDTLEEAKTRAAKILRKVMFRGIEHLDAYLEQKESAEGADRDKGN